MSEVFSVISPVDGKVLIQRPWATPAMLDGALARGHAAAPAWAGTTLTRRVRILHRLVDAFVAQSDEMSPELSWQMGRPVRYSGGEINGFAQRARVMLQLAPEALADHVPEPQPGFTRFVRRVPHGLVLVLSPWNYPYLTAVNAVIPALAAGNTVLLKHSDQTPLCGDRIVAAGVAAGLPENVLQSIDADHGLVAKAVADPRVALVSFTGSVGGGHAVVSAASQRFVGINLELGGKDPAYVRVDADLDHAVPNVVEGAMFNSGQSCCAVERVYVHRDRYADFLDAAVAEVEKLRLGDPLDPSTTLGPMVRTRNADAVRAQVSEAIDRGARPLIDPAHFPAASTHGPYLAPQLLVDVDPDCALMRDETFGPAVGIVPVDDDEAAIAAMNDSRFGLTASIWSPDRNAALAIGSRLETGTVFLNRCDYLDPHLAWVGVKDSGRGCTLSQVGYEALTRPKSFHLRH